MLGKPVILLLFVLATYMTLYRGAIWAFVTVYLPTLLLLSSTPEINLPSLPDMSARVAVMYGIIGGLVIKGGEPLPFRFGIGDVLMLALSASAVLTSVLTEYFWTGVNTFGDQVLNVLAPYFLARAAFHLPEARRRAMWVCIFVVGLLGFWSLIELRLWPFHFTRTLQSLGLYVGSNVMVLMRFHLFRTQLSFCHPIDCGNSALLLAAMIALLASTTRVGLRNIYVQLGILAALWISGTSMSWSSYAGSFAALALFIGMWLVPQIGRVLPLVVIAMVISGFVAAHKLENMKLGEREEIGQSFSDSLWVRASIMQNSWPFATSAGAFGYGKTIKHRDLNLDSVDNSYLMLTMTRGWVCLGLFLLLPATLAVRVSQAFGRTTLPQHRLPITIAAAAIIGVMVAMFTVWFGFVYSYLWLITLAMAHSALDMLQYGSPQVTQAPPIVLVRRRPRVPIEHPVPVPARTGAPNFAGAGGR